MKFLFIAFVLLTATQAGSIQRKSFQDNLSDFIECIIKESGEDLIELFEAYEDELMTVYGYLAGQDFAQLLIEMESLPEFNALIDFIEDSGIEIHYYLDLLHEFLDLEEYFTLRNIEVSSKLVCEGSGNAVSSYLRQLIGLLPAEQLRILYVEKIENDAEFRATMQYLQSKRFSELWDDLWHSDLFQAEIIRLCENGIEAEVVVDVVLATMGVLGVYRK